MTAYECGAIVNPANVRTQIEGATIMGLGGALFEAIRFDAGRILNASLRAYRVPRFTDVPPIDVVLLDRPDLPSAGAGDLRRRRPQDPLTAAPAGPGPRPRTAGQPARPETVSRAGSDLAQRLRPEQDR